MSVTGGAELVKAARVLNALASGHIVQRPVDRFLERAGRAVLGDARKHSPVGEGRTRGSLAQGAPDGVWNKKGRGFNTKLEVGTNVSHRGFPYPKVLDESGRHHYRYTGRRGQSRGGPFMGQPTKGWFSGSPDRAGAKIEKFFGKLGDEILKEATRMM